MCTLLYSQTCKCLDTSKSTELMSGAKSRKWVHQNQPTNQPTNQMAALNMSNEWVSISVQRGPDIIKKCIKPFHQLETIGKS